MGFFKRIFRKKKGGTRLGNALRAFLFEQTYGLFGTETGKPKN